MVVTTADTEHALIRKHPLFHTERPSSWNEEMVGTIRGQAVQCKNTRLSSCILSLFFMPH